MSDYRSVCHIPEGELGILEGIHCLYIRNTVKHIMFKADTEGIQIISKY